jgi:hypothetical protein
MPKTRGTGLLMLWTDVDPEHEKEFNRWYDEEHIGRLLGVPGFLSAGRYVAVKGGPKYLAMYELEEPNVLLTRAFLDEVRYRPSPWRTKASGGHVGRNYLLRAYRQIFPVRTQPVEATMGPPPALRMGRIDVPAAMEEEFNDWYDTAYIPALRSAPGALGARRFVTVEGRPKYLTVHDLADPGVPDSEPWLRARSANPWTARVFPHLRFDDGCPATYQRIFPK